MASGNEIKHRISIDGADEAKKQLKAVGDVGKQSMADIERTLATANAAGKGGSPLGALRGSADALGKALSPALGEVGNAAKGLLGDLGGIGGLFTRLAGGLSSSAGLLGTLAAIRAKMAEIGDETKKRNRASGRSAEARKVSASSTRARGNSVSAATRCSRASKIFCRTTPAIVVSCRSSAAKGLPGKSISNRTSTNFSPRNGRCFMARAPAERPPTRRRRQSRRSAPASTLTAA
jgi:hypothetical protein